MLIDGIGIARDIATFLGAAGTLVFLYDRFGAPMRRLVGRADEWRRQDERARGASQGAIHDRNVRRLGYAVAVSFCFTVYAAWSAEATMIASLLWFFVLGAIGQRVDYRTSTFVFEFTMAASMFGFVFGDVMGMLLLLLELVARPSLFVAALLFLAIGIAFAWAAESWF